MNETIQEIFKKYGEYPSGEFPHIEWLKGRLLELDDEIEEIQKDRMTYQDIDEIVRDVLDGMPLKEKAAIANLDEDNMPLTFT